MNFTIHGGYEIPRDNNRIITRDQRRRKAFWEEIEDDIAGLSTACGCYIVTIRGIPWYVGSAQRQDFKHECLTPHKLNQYDAALTKSQGCPHIYFVARRTPQGRFCRTTSGGYRDVGFLESTFIGMALQRNDKLQNIRGTSLLKDLHVAGFVNSRPGEGRAFAVRKLRSVLGA